MDPLEDPPEEELSDAETVAEPDPSVQFGEDWHLSEEVRVLEQAAAAAFLDEESQAASSVPAAPPLEKSNGRRSMYLWGNTHGYTSKT